MKRRPEDQLEHDLAALLDGELDAERAAEVRRQVAADPRLAEELRLLEETWELLGVLPEPQADRIDVTAKVMARVAAERRRQQGRVLWMRRGVLSALTAAAAVLLAVFIGLIAQPRPTDHTLESAMVDPGIPDEIERFLVTNLDVIENRLTLQHYEDVKALDEEGVFARGEPTETR